jgi:uncharacterized repeat protein (TIGR01451 family)
MRRSLPILALLLASSVHAQQLRVPAQTGAINTAGQTFVVQFTPGPDTGTFDFALAASPSANLTITGVAGSIPNGVTTCDVTASTVTCLAGATSATTDLGAGHVTVTYTSAGNAGPIALDFTSAQFFDQNGDEEVGSALGGTLTLPQGPQATLTASATPSSIVYGATSALAASGGSGSGAVSFAVTAGGARCAVSGSTLTATGVGSCTVTATRAGDANYLPATASVEVNVAQAPQAALSVAATPSTVVLGTTSALSTSGGSGTGALTYAVTSGAGVCSLNGSTLTGTGIGQCTVTATKAADANHLAASATTTVVVENLPTAQSLYVPDQSGQIHLAGQTLLVQYIPGNNAGSFDFTLSANPAGRVSFTGASGSIANGTATCSTSTTQVSCSVVANAPGSDLGSGALSISYTGGPGAGAVAIGFGSANFRLRNGSSGPGNATGGSLSLVRATQAALSVAASPAAIVYGGTSTLSTTGGSGSGAVSFAITAGGGVCALSGATLTATGIGSCTVTATKAGDADFDPASASTTVSVAKATQAPLTVVANPTTLFVGGSSALSSSGGSGSGGVSYAVTAGGSVCSIAGSTLTGTGVGQCTVTATRAGDANYLPATATTTLTVNSLPTTQSLSAPTVQGVLGASGQTFVVQYVPGPDSGAFDFVLASSPAGRVSFTGATASIPNGSTVCSANGGSVSCVATANSPSADLGPGAITITYDAGTTAGSVALQFTTANFFNQLGNVEPGSTTAGSVVLPRLDQAALAASASPASLSFGGSAALSTSGGSGSGAVSWVLTAGAGTCTLSGSTLVAVGVGNCTATATKAGDASYNPSSASVTLAVARAAQAPLTAVANPGSVPFGSTAVLSTSGGSGSGAVSWSVTSGATRCSISGTTLFATGVGSCTVTATKAGDANHLAASDDVVVTVTNTLPTLALQSAASTLEDLASAPIAITITDAETSPSDLVLSAVSSNQSLVADATLAPGFAGGGGSRSLVITPRPNASGSATITVSVADTDGGVRSQALALTVGAVNDAPDFSVPAVLTLAPGASGPQVRDGFASAITLGPPDEQQSQAVQAFALTEIADPDGVVQSAQLSADGTLSLVVSGTPGVARLRALLTDSGGTANGGVATSAPREFDVVVPLATDLALSLDDGRTNVLPGATLRYALTLTNAGPSTASAAHLQFAVPAGLGEAMWSCEAQAPAVCPTAVGTGGIDRVFDVPVGGAVRFELFGVVQAAVGAVLNATALVSVPVGLVDLQPNDNTAVDNTPVVPEVILGSGFEGGALAPPQASE